MAMRDPGTPGRNPFFDHGPDAELGDLAADRDDLGAEAFAQAFAAGGLDEHGFGSDGPGPGHASGSAPWPGAGMDPIGTLAAFVDALQGAQPEATEHLVAAAHELVLAVKSVVDATEAVLAAQRAAPRAPARDDEHDDGPVHDPFSSDEPEGPARTSGVRRIDLA